MNVSHRRGRGDCGGENLSAAGEETAAFADDSEQAFAPSEHGRRLIWVKALKCAVLFINPIKQAGNPADFFIVSLSRGK